MIRKVSKPKNRSDGRLMGRSVAFVFGAYEPSLFLPAPKDYDFGRSIRLA